MNLPHIRSYEDQAVDVVAYVINRAKEQLGDRPTLHSLIETRESLCKRPRLKVNLLPPIVKNAEDIIVDAINRSWKLSQVLLYTIRYLDSNPDSTSKCYHFEVIFSQPLKEYPIPQTSVKVFFRVQDDRLDPYKSQERPHPKITFRIEGHNQDHDIRYVKLNADWILGVMMMKSKLYQKIESFMVF